MGLAKRLFAKVWLFFNFPFPEIKIIVCLEAKGNQFILSGKLKDLNTEEIPITPIFGRIIVYDCPDSKPIEQKKVLPLFNISTVKDKSRSTSEARSLPNLGLLQIRSGHISL